MRLAIRLIRRDDISAQILITLRILLMMHPKVLLSCSKQISYGLHELIRTNASDIRYSRDWITILTILQVVGAGANPPIVKPGPCLTLVAGDLSTSEEKIDTETGEVYQTGEQQIDRGLCYNFCKAIWRVIGKFASNCIFKISSINYALLLIFFCLADPFDFHSLCCTFVALFILRLTFNF